MSRRIISTISVIRASYIIFLSILNSRALSDVFITQEDPENFSERTLYKSYWRTFYGLLFTTNRISNDFLNRWLSLEFARTL